MQDLNYNISAQQFVFENLSFDAKKLFAIFKLHLDYGNEPTFSDKMFKK